MSVPGRKVVRVKRTVLVQFNSRKCGRRAGSGHNIYIEFEDLMNRIVALSFIFLTAVAIAESTSTIFPAERSVANAMKAIAAKPKDCTGYNQLAIALSRRARETSDPTFYAAAEKALEKSFELWINLV